MQKGFSPVVLILIVTLVVITGGTYYLQNSSPVSLEESEFIETVPITSGDIVLPGSVVHDVPGVSPGGPVQVRTMEKGSSAALRESACPSPGSACPSPQSPVCHDGKWYCRLYTSDGASAGARTADTSGEVLNYPTETQLREGVCGEPALACPAPEIPECKSGKWLCIGPADPAGSGAAGGV